MNLGWLFYVDYFKDFDLNDLDKSSKNIKKRIAKILRQKVTPTQNEQLGTHSFRATTTYPGLLLGSGYLHELPDVKDQLILGFDFDYTTGLPIIRGSSIKGVLRSAFRHPDYIQELLKKSDIDIAELEKDIFEANDIFFDAQIVAIKKDLLLDDYITPHRSKTQNPIPLHFIKVAPGVTFAFAFALHDGVIGADEKLALFKNILFDLGIGAKTNVGYGQIVDAESQT